jgi:hypothetical protein
MQTYLINIGANTMSDLNLLNNRERNILSAKVLEIATPHMKERGVTMHFAIRIAARQHPEKFNALHNCEAKEVAEFVIEHLLQSESVPGNIHALSIYTSEILNKLSSLVSTKQEQELLNDEYKYLMYACQDARKLLSVVDKMGIV